MLLVLVTGILMSAVEGSGSCSNTPFELNSEHIDTRLSGFYLGQEEEDNLAECAKECMFLTRCKSFSFDRQDQLCELYTQDSPSVPSSDLFTADGWIFSDLSVWPKIMFGTCADKPCGNDEICVPSKPYTCLTEVYGLTCGNDQDCQKIEGICPYNNCTCPTDLQYDLFSRKCVDLSTLQ